MAKARRPPQGPFVAAAERFLGFHHRGAAGQLGGGGGGAGAVAPTYGVDGDGDLPDLLEADIWYSPSTEGAAEDRRGGGGGGRLEVGSRGDARGAGTRRAVGGLSRAFADGRRQVAASAPVEVPAWPGRYADPDPAVYAEEKRREEAVIAYAADDYHDGWVPPHVYLARRQARSSMVEGAGRTLKGRDASRVRDAVWSQTGFDG
ncbi:hypothetical protein GUJ93_ZPchr0013g34456 [Zizania palustris]|uniref:Uncharacterized protein n=1 Tax=Zizania palustris TaxID=103762 RepID=A0A8J6BY05_ZIZPA|nr:hypothetical protein GUJ93_ZPchr0013g34456 [Zizania palustris]